MEATTEQNTRNDTLTLATWSRPRSTVELRAFVNRHDEALDVEEFDL